MCYMCVCWFASVLKMLNKVNMFRSLALYQKKKTREKQEKRKEKEKRYELFMELKLNITILSGFTIDSD